MTTSISSLLARRADVPRAEGARRRFVAAWAALLVFGGALAVIRHLIQIMPEASLLVSMLTMLLAAAYVWMVVEAGLMQRALREPRAVVVFTALGMLVPIAAPFLAVLMMIESRSVTAIARRMRRSECVWCGYSLGGISAEVCPECGHARGTE